MQVKHEARSHSGGVVLSVTPELLRPDQLQAARNGRERIRGAVNRREGTKRIHASALGSSGSFQGAVQWPAPGGNEVVAVRNGELFADTVSKSTGLDATARVSFAVHRKAGVPVLYGADGTKLWSYDGSVAMEILGAPAMGRIAVYNSRLFGTNAGGIYFSGIDSPEIHTVDSGAGFAKVETYDTEDLNGLTVLGSALLMFKENNISRFTGYSKLDINIDTGTDGVSDEVGLLAPESLVRVEDVAFFLSDRGPYFATVDGVREVGFNVDSIWDFDDRTAWSKAVSVHNRRRREIWLFVPGVGDTTNTTCWVLNYRTMTWWGPWDVPFDVGAGCRYEKSTGVESVLLAGDDGFLRDGDESNGYLDDMLSDGTGGQIIPLEVTYSPFGIDFNRAKRSGPEWHVRANLGPGGELVMDVANEYAESFTSAPVPSKGDGVRDYALRPHYSGKQLTATVSDYTANAAQINSLQAEVKVGRET